MAMDATLAGNPARALLGGVTKVSDIEALYGAKFVRGLSADNLAYRIGASGPGSRGIVFGHRGPGKVGHFFNVVRQRDTGRFIDAQTGAAANLDDGFIEFWLLQTK